MVGIFTATGLAGRSSKEDKEAQIISRHGRIRSTLAPADETDVGAKVDQEGRMLKDDQMKPHSAVSPTLCTQHHV